MMFPVDLLYFSFNFSKKYTLVLVYSSWGLLFKKKASRCCRAESAGSGNFLVLVQAELFFVFFFLCSSRLCHSLTGTSQHTPTHIKAHSCNVHRTNIYSQTLLTALLAAPRSFTGESETWPEWATKINICAWSVDLCGFGNQPQINRDPVHPASISS